MAIVNKLPVKSKKKQKKFKRPSPAALLTTEDMKVASYESATGKSEAVLQPSASMDTMLVQHNLTESQDKQNDDAEELQQT